jgi:iron uptake system component EfeO
MTISSLAALSLVIGCTSNKSVVSDTKGAITVKSTAATCTLSATTAASGTLTFDIKNEGSEITEFYLYAEDGVKIISEMENIGPGTSRKLVVQVNPGKYLTACKPGMKGDGIRAPFTVTGDVSKSDVAQKVDGDVKPLLDIATKEYAVYVRDQVGELVAKTQTFTDLYIAGKDDEARSLYADVRVHWERIEPVAESFGDIDPKIDLREADLEEGQQWTGWHALEKDLWPPVTGYTPLSSEQRTKMAQQLVVDTKDLESRLPTLQYNVSQIGNGAKELLDEVSTTKMTGEEETWSHTDLWDVQANIDGAHQAFLALKPALEKKDPALASKLVEEFSKMKELLNKYKKGTGFILYTELTPGQIKELATAVNTLGEPLSQLTAKVLS